MNNMPASRKRKVGETKEDDSVEWFVYGGGIVEPKKGVKYTHIRVEGTARIDEYAFNECRNELLRVEICEGVEEIGERAFLYCEHLESVTLPSTLTSIESKAFCGCTKLARVELCEGLKLVASYAFKECNSLEFINLPSTLTSIGGGPFEGCTGLMRDELAEGLVSINSYAFYGCESLQCINLPSTLTSIGERVFQDCKAIKSMNIPSGVTSIGNAAFQYCVSLEHVILHEGRKELRSYTFLRCISLCDITLPSTLQIIESGTFRGCHSLANINIPSSVAAIGWGAFMGCSNLKEVTFQSPHHLRTIGQHTFCDCLALEEIKIPPTVQEIGSLSFGSCENLKRVDLCGGSPKVDRYAFVNCGKLDHCNIIATGKMNIDTFTEFAGADLFRRIGSMADEREAIIETKLEVLAMAFPNRRYYVWTLFRIPQSMQDSLAKMHGLITYWELKESTTILELAIWKLNLDTDTDVGSRQRIRQQCGRDMQVIMSGVLQFFDYSTDE